MKQKKQKKQSLKKVPVLILLLIGTFCFFIMCNGNKTICADASEIRQEAAVDGEKARTDRIESEQKKISGLYALSACLWDAKGGRMLYDKNADERRPMASTTKIMTLLVVLENADMRDVVTVSENAAKQPDVQLHIRAGEQYYLIDLLYSLMLESHNDTAVALAEHVGGSVEGFAAMMNEKAKALGLYNTHFVTPNGLDAEGHYTTARELAMLSAYAIQNEQFVKITNTAWYSFTDIHQTRTFSVSNKNRFLGMMNGAIGVKTGFTGKAGYCFAGAVRKGSYELICVVLGCGWPPNKGYKWKDSVKLMNYGFDNYKEESIYDRAVIRVNGENVSGEHKEFLSYIPNFLDVQNGIQEKVQMEVRKDSNATEKLLLADWDQTEIEIRYPEFLTAPVQEGEVIGCVEYRINGEILRRDELLLKESVKEKDFTYYLKLLWFSWMKNSQNTGE